MTNIPDNPDWYPHLHDIPLRKPRAGSVLFRQGDREDAESATVFIIEFGYLKLEHVTGEGKLLLPALLGRGDVLLARAMLDHGRFSCTAGTKTPCRLWSFSTAHWNRLAGIRPRLWEELLAQLARQQSEDRQRLLLMASESLRHRAAQALLHLLAAKGGPCRHAHQVDVPLTQGEFAAYLGATRQAVNPLLRDWSRRGLIFYTRRYLCVNDLRQLEGELAATVA